VITSYYSSLDIYKEFQEEAYSVAIHPSGLFVLVGFSEKLRLLNILIDDIRVFKEIAIRGCREVRYHHQLAILIYSCYSVHLVMEDTCLLQLVLILFSYFPLTLLITLVTLRVIMER